MARAASHPRNAWRPLRCASPSREVPRNHRVVQCVLVGEGFDPVDGASRVRAMSRARDAVYASIREGDEAIAAGDAAFKYGWASIHAMRTAQARRREGLAGRVLSALAEVALERGLARMFLQVEDGYGGTLSLYCRAGFFTAWRYDYWTR